MPRVSGMRELKLLKVDGSNIREMRAESLKDLPALRYFHLAQSKGPFIYDIHKIFLLILAL